MKLYIVRHGETNYNVLGLHNADPAIRVVLTKKGIQDAKDVAQKLQSTKIDQIFVSELPRTQETANIINREHQAPITIDARLNDINAGFEGKSVHENHALRDAAPDSYNFRHEGHESPSDVHDRIANFLDSLRANPTLQSQNILVVTSKHCYRHFQSLIDGIDPRQTLRQNIPNGQILEREI